MATRQNKLSTVRLILQRKEFHSFVPGHPGLGMGPSGDLVAVDVVLHRINPAAKLGLGLEGGL